MLLAISLVLLVPLIPTLIIYKVIRDKRTQAKAHGTLFGLKFESSGAIATYVICTALLLLVGKTLIPRDYEKVQVSIGLTGDPSIISRFMEKAESSAKLTLTANGVEPIRFDRFIVNSNQRTLTAERELPPAYLGKTFNVDLSFAGDHLVVKPTSVVLQKTILLETVLGSDSQRRAWTALLDTTSHVFANQAQDIYSKEIILLTHDSPEPLESIILHNYLISAPLVYMEVGARLVDRKTLDGMMQQWSRDSLANIGPDGYSAYFDGRFQEYKGYGEELAIRHFTNDDYNLPGQGSRFQRGNISLLDADHLIPIIGPIPGGIGSDKAVIVFVDNWWKTFPPFQRSATELTLGQTYERYTKRVLFGLSSSADKQMDCNSVRTQFKQDLITPVPRMGDAQVLKGTNSVVLDLNELASGNVLNVLWSWK